MIGHAADLFRDSTEALDGAGEIGVEALAPGFMDGVGAIFGAEDDVVMEAQIGGSHGERVESEERESDFVFGCR